MHLQESSRLSNIEVREGKGEGGRGKGEGIYALGSMVLIPKQIRNIRVENLTRRYQLKGNRQYH